MHHAEYSTKYFDFHYIIIIIIIIELLYQEHYKSFMKHTLAVVITIQ